MGRSPGSGQSSDDPHTVVEAVGVTRRFGAVTALDGASFRIGPGVTGLLGANGAGKTTLLGLVLGLHRPDDGRLRVLDLDPFTAGPEVRSRVGYSPEHHLLPPDTRAHDLVRHLAEVHGLPRREATARASDALWQVGLGEERYRPVGTMSTGQRQRVKLAQAIAHDPALVLLDEPTDGLDPVQRDEMLSLIRRVGTEFGIHVVISSHLLDEIERTCDAAVILRDGMVVAAGPLSELTGAGTGLVVEVDDHPEVVAELVRARGLDVTLDGLRLVVTTRTADGADTAPVDPHDAARDAVVEAGVGVRRLSDRTVRLEDVFLEVGA
jgi:ABC-2 type transport system ATP-binding protein